MKKTLLIGTAVVVALPALVLTANFVFYAFTGADFLPETSSYVGVARLIVFACSAGLAAALLLEAADLAK